MARAGLKDTFDYYTAAQVLRKLNLSRRQLKNRIGTEIFMKPTKQTPLGNRLFDERWLRHAQIQLMFENKLIDSGQRNAALAELDNQLAEEKLLETMNPPKDNSTE